MYLERMDGTQAGSIQVAQDKALCAFKFKRPTKILADMVLGGNVNLMALSGAVPVEGGLPIFFGENNTLLGSIGVSGVTSAQDGEIAAAGLVYFS